MALILLVEDDIWQAELYSESLSTEFQVQHVPDANQALNWLDKNIPDLILLDLFLPGHSGIELIHELSSYSDTGYIPIVVLSTVALAEFALPQERWEQYGIVDYLYKPELSPIIIPEIINNRLKVLDAQ